MTPEELYSLSLEKVPEKIIHPIFKAILEECCERAIDNAQKVTDTDMLVFAVHVAFLTSISALKGVLKSSFEFGEQVTLNYRGQTFQIKKESDFLEKIMEN